MAGRKRWVALAVVAVVVLAGLLLPLVPITKSISIPVYRVHACGPCGGPSNVSYAIRGMSSVIYTVFGVGQPPYSNPHFFETNNTYYCYAVFGSGTFEKSTFTHS